eukprot:GHVS01079236.1.p1 GENE.GHVS01079236.1~~GHVS01079236.1.p1  ORF type:complete len:186 (+),score=36.96 GHVS01079236.1:150-707(+)
MDNAMVGKVVESNVLQALQEKEAKVDEEIRKLDNLKGDDMDELRNKRLQQLKAHAAEKQTLSGYGHGAYQELYNEKEFFQAAKQSAMLVVHFYRPSNNHCQLVDRALLSLSEKHIGTRFVKINAEKSEFLCTRLKIWMLPTVHKERERQHNTPTSSEVVHIHSLCVCCWRWFLSKMARPITPLSG